MRPVKIVFAFDRGFLLPTAVALHSLLRHAKGAVDLQIFGYALDDTDRGALDHIAARFETKLTHHILTAERVTLAAKTRYAHVSGASHLRLALPEYLDGEIAYLDGDILLRRDIGELYARPIANGFFAAAPSAATQFSVNYAKRFDAGEIAKNKRQHERHMRRAQAHRNAGANELHFNAGIFRLDIDALRRVPDVSHAFTDRAAVFGAAGGCDENYLNLILRGRVAPLPLRWNAQIQVQRPNFRHMTPPMRADWYDAYHDPAIVHFTSQRKPWQRVSLGFLWQHRRRFFEYRREMRAVDALLHGGLTNLGK